jgi:hypothetical protein
MCAEKGLDLPRLKPARPEPGKMKNDAAGDD